MRLVIRHTYEGEEFVGVHMLLASEMDGETFSDDVCDHCIIITVSMYVCYI